MLNDRAFAASTVLLGLVALGHALLTWPLPAIVALFGGGTLVAFVAEAIVVHRGWLEHHIGPFVAGVPVYVLFGWTAIAYLAFRVALLGTAGWTAVVAAAVLATTYDLLTDHYGVTAGYWTYTGGPPGPRLRSVPWWNFVGWFAVTAVTTAVALPFV